MDQNAFHCCVAKCNDSFTSGKNLITHIKLQHSVLSIQKFSCKFGDCFREFDKVKSFIKHVATHDKIRLVSPDVGFQSKRIRLDSVNEDFENGDISTCTSGNDLNAQESHCDIGDESGSSLPKDDIVEPLAFFHGLANHVISVLSRLYCKDSLTRNHIQDIVDCMKDLVSGTFMDILQDSVIQALKMANYENISSISCLFDIFRGMFDDLDTEHKRFSFFKKQDAYIEPEEYIVGTANVEKNVKGQIVLQPTSLSGSFIPPTKSLKMFLELPGVYDEITTYMDSLDPNPDVMENIIQGSLWREEIKPKFEDKTVFPVNISYDDFETNKYLGSHSGVHKLGAVHIQIACLPPKFQSVLENILLTALFYTSDKHFGLEEVFRPVLEDLKKLEDEGIDIVIKKGSAEEPPCIKRVYFALCMILADNLGINTILGLVESFRANYFCRICKVHRDVTEHLVKERVDLLRTLETYENDVRKKDTVSTGIKEKCIWNELQSFSITQNIYADIMHDVIEGCGDYDMCFVIETLVQKKCFTYDELNDLVQGFYFGDQEFGNKPPLITAEHVAEESLKFSASEMLCLIRYFPLMVGHKVKKDEPAWKFYLLLRQLVDILFSPTIARSSLDCLDELITEHHEMYLKLSKRKLRPKFHNALHYCRIIRKVGSLKPLWTMRTEAKYKEYRQAAAATSCRKKITQTLAVKQSLKMCVRALTHKGLVRKFSFSPFCETVEVCFLDDFENFQHKLPVSEMKWNVVKWVNVDGTLYKPDMVVVTGLDDFFPRFGVIKVISIKDNDEAMFLIKELDTLGFDSHLHSYHVKECASWDCWRYIPQQDLVSYVPAHKRVFFDGRYYLMLRQPV